MKSILTAAMTLLVITSAAAQPLDYAPTAQLRYEMKFGGGTRAENTQALRLAAGMTRPLVDDASTLQDRMTRSASTAPLVSLIDTSYSFRSREGDVRVAGFDLTARNANPALDATGERSWWSNNWAWVALGGIAAVAVVAVTAIHDGTNTADQFSGNNNNNQCPGPVSVQNGNTCTRP